MPGHSMVMEKIQGMCFGPQKGRTMHTARSATYVVCVWGIHGFSLCNKVPTGFMGRERFCMI